MSQIQNLWEDAAWRESFFKLASMAEMAGMDMDEFADFVAPLVNAGAEVGVQELQDFLLVHSSELTKEELKKVSGGGGFFAIDSDGNVICGAYIESAGSGAGGPMPLYGVPCVVYEDPLKDLVIPESTEVVGVPGFSCVYFKGLPTGYESK